MVSSKKWNRGGRRGEGSESSCWKQSWLGEGFLIPPLHTGNAGAVSVSGAVPQKAKYPKLSTPHRLFSLEQDPFCWGRDLYNRRRCFLDLPLCRPPPAASCLRSGNPLKTLLWEPLDLDSGAFHRLPSVMCRVLFLKGRLDGQPL